MQRPTDILSLDALVLAEIESLGQGQPSRAADPWSGATRDPMHNPTGDRPRGRPRPPPERTRAAPPAARLHPGPDRDPRRTPRARSGEEAEGLFDEPFDPADPGAGRYDDPAADGPTAADLLTPEEQAFIARAAGFLSGRPNADLILDRIWSQAIESRADGLYDPESADALPELKPEPEPEPSAEASGPAPRAGGWPEPSGVDRPAQRPPTVRTGGLGVEEPALSGLAAARPDGRQRGRRGPVGVSSKPQAAETCSDPSPTPISTPTSTPETPTN
jgi:hypothetical protein